MGVEYEERKIVVKWLKSRKWIDFFGVINEGKRSYRLASMYKAIGLQAGIPDIIIINSPPLKPYLKGTVIEMKADKKKKLSKEQIKWRHKFEREKFFYIEGFGSKDTIQKLIELGY